ncbi:MAG: HDOD domain-containing protein [Deltaproteobacteria bacterium]|nr:HDOD domain-containing protein [Deltaproteobacteria bacterium]
MSHSYDPDIILNKTLSDKIEKLPALPTSINNILELLNKLDSEYEDIVAAIDPTLAARFLQASNAAFYGRHIDSIQYAVRVLGYSTMRGIVLSVSLLNVFEKKQITPLFNYEKFERQAQLCAFNATTLAQLCKYEHPDKAYSVGLLHNIGKLLIAAELQEGYKKINELTKKGGMSSSEAEKRVLGHSHSELGAAVMKHYELPSDIVQAVWYHDMDTLGNIPRDDEDLFELCLITREAVEITDRLKLPGHSVITEIVQEQENIADDIRDGIEQTSRHLLESPRKQVLPELLLQASSVLINILRNRYKFRVRDVAG